MSDTSYSIEARTPTGPVLVWTYTFALALYALIPGVLININVDSGSSALRWGIAEIALAVLSLAVFGLYTRHRDDAAGSTTFTYSTLPGRRLYPAGLVRGYAIALLPLGIAWGAMGIGMVASGVGASPSSATATISSGPRTDSVVSTWRASTSIFHPSPSGLKPVAEEDLIAAHLGETVRLTGHWGGVEEITIESVTTSTFHGTWSKQLFPGAPLGYDGSCLVVTGTQRTASGTLSNLHFFFTESPGGSTMSDGKAQSDFFAPSQYTRPETDDFLHGANECPRGRSSGLDYKDITINPDQDLPDGGFLVKFQPYSTIGAPHPSRYLGVQTSEGTVMYWDLGERH